MIRYLGRQEDYEISIEERYELLVNKIKERIEYLSKDSECYEPSLLLDELKSLLENEK